MSEDEGERRKRRGMEKAKRTANPVWWAACGRAVVKLARTQRYQTTDDVLRLVPEGITTPNYKALGPLMLECAKQEIVTKALVDHVKTARSNNHRRPLQVWESLL